MGHLHYFASNSQEAYDLAGACCAGCGSSNPGEYGWWELAGAPHCTDCTRLAEAVAEAGGEPLVLGQVLTLAQQAALAA
jgi:hypothetical protein